jgi:hypothetical protein
MDKRAYLAVLICRIPAGLATKVHGKNSGEEKIFWKASLRVNPWLGFLRALSA